MERARDEHREGVGCVVLSICCSWVSCAGCVGSRSDLALAWSQYLDSTQPDPFSRWMTPGSRLLTHLAILAGRYPCKPHTALRSGFTLTGWLWREYPACSASGWMVSRVCYGENGGTWSECAATNETPTTRSKRARKIRSIDGDAHMPARPALDSGGVSHGAPNKPSKKRKKIETKAQPLLPCA